MATTDAKPQAGVGSSTTAHVCNSAITDGDKCQHIALVVASGRLHGGKTNRFMTHAQIDGSAHWLTVKL